MDGEGGLVESKDRGHDADIAAFLGDDERNQAEIDQFFDDANMPDAPADDLLEVMQTFVKGYEKSLKEVQEALTDGTTAMWDAEMDCVEIDCSPYDADHILNMLSTNNAQFNKIALVFATLVAEIKYLRSVAEEQFYGPITMFGHANEREEDDKKANGTTSTDNKTGTPEAQMGMFLPLLQNLCNFVSRVHAVVRNMVNQLSCLYHERQKLYLSTFAHVNLESVFEALGEACRVLITLDALVTDNGNISLAWNSYKRMIKYVRADPDRYGVESGKLRAFEGLLLQIDRQILTANMFETCLAQDYGLAGAASSKALVAGNRVLHEQFRTQIKNFRQRITATFGESVEKYDRIRLQSVETYPRVVLVDLFGLYALHRRLFKGTHKPDKAMFKSLWEIQKKVPVVHLYGRACFFIAEFLAMFAPLQASSLSPPSDGVKKARVEAMMALDASFARDVELLYQVVCMWMVRMESDVPGANNIKKVGAVLNERSKLLLTGILLANEVRNMLTVNVSLHLQLEQPFLSKNVSYMALCAEILKCIQHTFHRRSTSVGENIAHMLGQTAFTLKRLLLPVKQALEKGGTGGDDGKLDVLAAVTLALNMLSLAPTRERRVVLDIALAIVQRKNMLRKNHEEEARYQMWKLHLLAEWQARLANACNCDILYWVVDLVPAFVQHVWNHPDEVCRLPYLLSALRDPASMLTKVAHNANRGVYLSSYQATVLQYVTENLIDPLCRAVETDLRLHIHSVVLEQANLRDAKIKDLYRFLNMKPLKFFNHMIDLGQRVTHYLDSIFYNLTTVTLHDWKVYAEMRNLALEKYGLTMTEVHLPGHAHYSEALDVLEIMRNIHIFVARYNYNMNTQMFVERAMDQAHLNTINIAHIANSIRTHGTGIMNTTVNFTYQFLCRKFIIFSEFLYDDHIKSRLMKDIRAFKSEKDKLDNKYPYERAEKFNRKIAKLGKSDDGATFMDQFRRQITEVGNALGYVRMVRSGGMQHVSDAIKFVPDIDNIQSFVEAVQKNDDEGKELSAHTRDAAKNLDAVLDDLSRNFAEGADYFSVLVRIFQGVFLGEKQAHLRNFYMIVPPLTLNFVEKMMAQKEALKKKGGRGEASFTDDGFALGLAYIFVLLDQSELFDSLHWFDSVNDHIHSQIAQVTEQMKKKRGSAEEQQYFLMSIRRLETIKMEFDLLFYSFSGARIFFRDSAFVAEAPASAEGGAAAAPAAPAADATATTDTSVPAAPPAPTAPPAPPLDIPMAPPM